MKNRVTTFLSTNNTFSPGTLRLGLTFGMIIYGVFGYLDLYAMPSNYVNAWIIRYAIIFPLLIITFFLSYYQPFYRYSKTILFLLLSVGQIGIIAMIGISKPDDLAFSTYYAGLILIMLWAAYIFRVNFYITIYMAISTILLYNLTMLFKQYLLSSPYRSTDMAILLNNNFFLISSAVLISIGAHQFERILRENSEFNAEIISEKEQLKLAKEQTEKSEEKFRKLFENSPVGISMTGIDGALSVNTSFCNILGYSEDELRTIKWMDITHPEDINLTNQFIQSLADGKVPQVRFEKRYIHKNGHIIWTDHFSYMELDTHSNRLQFISSITDITENKHAQEELKKLNEELDKVNEELEQRVIDRTAQLEMANKELESFSYSVSHDLRTPLRALDGFANILLQDYAPILDDEGKRMLNIIIANANRMGVLIDDILSFSRLGRQELTFSKIDMYKMAKSVYTELATDLDNIEFRLQQIPEAMGDPSLMKQVWANLISNSIKFTSLKTERVIEIGSSTIDYKIRYHIKDNGAGFNMDYSNKLFKVYHRLHTDREFEGTGIGLSIVQRIVQKHGGRIWAEGKVNEGATFYFTLGDKL